MSKSIARLFPVSRILLVGRKKYVESKDGIISLLLVEVDSFSHIIDKLEGEIKNSFDALSSSGTERLLRENTAVERKVYLLSVNPNLKLITNYHSWPVRTH